MPAKKIFLAAIVSLPLLPFLLISKETFNQEITGKAMILAAPLVLEFVGFYSLYEFVKDRGSKFSKKEQKALLLLVVGMFMLLATPVLLVELFQPTPGVSISLLVLAIVYALASLIINTKQIYESSALVKRYFWQRYLLPAGLALGLGLILISDTTVNPVAAYLILKNFTLTTK